MRRNGLVRSGADPRIGYMSEAALPEPINQAGQTAGLARVIALARAIALASQKLRQCLRDAGRRSLPLLLSENTANKIEKTHENLLLLYGELHLFGSPRRFASIVRAVPNPCYRELHYSLGLRGGAVGVVVLPLSSSISTLVSRTVPRTVSGRSTISLRTTTSSAPVTRFSANGSSCRSTTSISRSCGMLRSPVREIGRCSISTRSSRTVTVFSIGRSTT